MSMNKTENLSPSSILVEQKLSNQNVVFNGNCHVRILPPPYIDDRYYGTESDDVSNLTERLQCIFHTGNLQTREGTADYKAALNSLEYVCNANNADQNNSSGKISQRKISIKNNSQICNKRKTYTYVSQLLGNKEINEDYCFQSGDEVKKFLMKKKNVNRSLHTFYSFFLVIYPTEVLRLLEPFYFRYDSVELLQNYYKSTTTVVLNAHKFAIDICGVEKNRVTLPSNRKLIGIENKLDCIISLPDSGKITWHRSSPCFRVQIQGTSTDHINQIISEMTQQLPNVMQRAILSNKLYSDISKYSIKKSTKSILKKPQNCQIFKESFAFSEEEKKLNYPIYLDQFSLNESIKNVTEENSVVSDIDEACLVKRKNDAHMDRKKVSQTKSKLLLSKDKQTKLQKRNENKNRYGDESINSIIGVDLSIKSKNSLDYEGHLGKQPTEKTFSVINTSNNEEHLSNTSTRSSPMYFKTNSNLNDAGAKQVLTCSVQCDSSASSSIFDEDDTKWNECIVSADEASVQNKFVNQFKPKLDNHYKILYESHNANHIYGDQTNDKCPRQRCSSIVELESYINYESNQTNGNNSYDCDMTKLGLIQQNENLTFPTIKKNIIFKYMSKLKTKLPRKEAKHKVDEVIMQINPSKTNNFYTNSNTEMNIKENYDLHVKSACTRKNTNKPDTNEKDNKLEMNKLENYNNKTLCPKENGDITSHKSFNEDAINYSNAKLKNNDSTDNINTLSSVFIENLKSDAEYTQFTTAMGEKLNIYFAQLLLTLVNRVNYRDIGCSNMKISQFYNMDHDDIITNLVVEQVGYLCLTTCISELFKLTDNSKIESMSQIFDLTYNLVDKTNFEQISEDLDIRQDQERKKKEENILQNDFSKQFQSTKTSSIKVFKTSKIPVRIKSTSEANFDDSQMNKKPEHNDKNINSFSEKNLKEKNRNIFLATHYNKPFYFKKGLYSDYTKSFTNLSKLNIQKIHKEQYHDNLFFTKPKPKEKNSSLKVLKYPTTRNDNKKCMKKEMIPNMLVNNPQRITKANLQKFNAVNKSILSANRNKYSHNHLSFHEQPICSKDNERSLENIINRIGSLLNISLDSEDDDDQDDNTTIDTVSFFDKPI